MKYIDYKNMKDFYTIAEVCRLFEMEMIELVHPVVTTPSVQHMKSPINSFVVTIYFTWR